jgi:hypothetical protein
MAIHHETVADSSPSQSPFKLIERTKEGYKWFCQRLERAGEWLDAREVLLLAFLVLFYIVLTLPPAIYRPLWHDELFTYNLALSASVPQMLENIRHVDLNPPVLYLLDYVALRLPGAQANEHLASLAARLPSLLGGLMASLGFFALLRTRMGPLYSLAAVVLLWNTSLLFYSYEDRPYALVCGLLVLLILAWERATKPGRNPLWIAAVLGLGCALMGSHFMGIFLLLAFLAAEGLRTWQRGRLDIPLCLALLVPFAIPLLYLGKISSSGAIMFPAAFQPRLPTFGAEYLVLLNSSINVFITSLVFCTMATLLPRLRDSQAQSASDSSAPTLPERLLLLVLLLEPLMFVTSAMLRHASFFPRYGLPGCIPLAILMIVLFYQCFHRVRRVALIVACVSVTYLLWPRVEVVAKIERSHPRYDSSAISHRPDFRQVEAELPLVAASGLTFVEMNHRESADMLRRTYYLTDEQAAITYAHATLFEGEAEVSRTFHFRGQVEGLRSFEASHGKFLVLGTLDSPEDWLLRELQAEGAHLRYMGNYDTSYKDKSLYEVVLSGRL